MRGLKCDAVMFSILGELSDDKFNGRYKILKDRLCKVSLVSVVLSRDPVSDMDRVFNIALICKELLLYHNTFGFEQQFVKEILKDDHIRQKLNANSIIEIQPADEAMRKFVLIELKKLRTSEARESSYDLIRPITNSLESAFSTGRVTFRLLSQVLDGCRDDAKLVYSHRMNVDV